MKLILTVNEGTNKQRRIVAYLDSFSFSRDLRQARLVSHKGMISVQEPHKGMISGEELSALLPSVLYKAFKDKL